MYSTCGIWAASSALRHSWLWVRCCSRCRISIPTSAPQSKNYGSRTLNPDMPSYFTLSQAQRLIPQVERLLRDALFHKHEFQKAHEELERTTERIRMAGGSRVNPSAMLSLRARRDTSASTLQQVLDEIQGTGAMVKDLDIGL